MKRAVFVIACAILLGWGANAPPSQAANPQPLHNFYGIHTEVRDQVAFVRTTRLNLRIDRAKLVELYNMHYGHQFGHVRDFDDLLNTLGSDAFEVQPCRGHVFSYGFDDSGQFKAFPRGCYENELVLVHRQTGVSVFSLLCGNLFQPTPIQLPPPLVYPPGAVSYTDKCGYWILYGCLDSQRVTQGHHSIIPQHD